MAAPNSASPFQTPSIDAPGRRRLPILLRHSWYGLNQAFRRRIAHLGLTPDQFTVMRTLIENGSITQRQLSGLMSSDANTIASLLERMEGAGLLDRLPHEKDRRARRLFLRTEGRRKFQRAREIAVALQAEVLSVMPESKREDFLQTLELVAEACRVSAEKSPKREKGLTA